MVKILLSLVLLVASMAAGIAAHALLQDPPPLEEGEEAVMVPEEEEENTTKELVRFDNQVVVPLNSVEDRQFLVVSVTVEVDAPYTDQIRLLEPRLRGRFLADLLDLTIDLGDPSRITMSRYLRHITETLNRSIRSELDIEDANVIVTDFVISNP